MPKWRWGFIGRWWDLNSYRKLSNDLPQNFRGMRTFGRAERTSIIDISPSIRYNDETGEGQISQGGFERQPAGQMHGLPDIISCMTLIVMSPLPCPMPSPFTKRCTIAVANTPSKLQIAFPDKIRSSWLRPTRYPMQKVLAKPAWAPRLDFPDWSPLLHHAFIRQRRFQSVRMDATRESSCIPAYVYHVLMRNLPGNSSKGGTLQVVVRLFIPL